MDNPKPFTDPADFYQDSAFPGRWMISLSISVWIVLAILPHVTPRIFPLPAWVETTQSLILLLTIPLYLIGFWKAVVSKGYSRILFLIAFAPIVGVIVIFFLPKLDAAPVCIE